MASNVYTGQVQGLSKISGGVPSAFCRKVSSGSFARDPHNTRNVGIGGQLVARKGIDEVTLEWTCVGPAKTDTALWFPTTAGVQVASFPDFLVEVDDTANGQEWVLSSGQPVSCTMSLGDGPDAEVEYTFAAKFKLVTEQAIGTDVPLYNTVKGHVAKDVTVQFAAADKGVLGFSLSNDLGTKLVNTLDTKLAAAKTQPLAYVVTSQDPKFSCTTTEVFKGTNMDDDEWTAEDIVLTLANGTAGENITVTLSSFKPDAWNMPLEAEDLVGFAHEFGPASGTLYNRVQFA